MEPTHRPPRFNRKHFVTLLVLGLLLFITIRYISPRIFSIYRPKKSQQEFVVETLRTSITTSDRGLVVFVHGIGGDRHTTWERKVKNSVKDTDATINVSMLNIALQDKELSSYDFATVDYPTHQTMDYAGFVAQVQSLRSYLDSASRRYERIILVCHSMGGLISSYALALSSVLDEPSNHVTLVTLSTPFNGSKVAHWIRTATTAQSRQLEALDNENEMVKLVNNFWVKFRHKHRDQLLHFAAGEQAHTDGVRIVEDDSSKGPPDGKADVWIPFEGRDHFDMASVVGPDDELYKAIRDWIRFCDATAAPDSFSKSERVDLSKSAIVSQGKLHEVHAGQVFEIGKDVRFGPGTQLVLHPGSIVKCSGAGILEVRGIVRAGAEGGGGELVTFDFSGAPADSDATLVLSGRRTKGSFFHDCKFKNGKGVRVERPNPKTFGDQDWDEFARNVKRNALRRSVGGGLVLLSVPQANLRNCEFVECAAYQGGAVYSLNSRRIDFANSRFYKNVSGFGGGGIFLHATEAYFDGCRFQQNSTGTQFTQPAPQSKGQSARSPSVGNAFACGGGIYVGHSSHVEIRQCDFVRNSADHAGGGVYCLDTNLDRQSREVPNILAGTRVIGNRCQSAAGGGGIHFDNECHFSLTDIEFVANSNAGGETSIGQDLVDWTHSHSDEVRQSGIGYAGNVTFYDLFARSSTESRDALAEPNVATDSRLAETTSTGGNSRRLVERELYKPETIKMLPIVDVPLTNPKCFRAVSAQRSVDTIVIHYTSASGWANADFVQAYKLEVEEFDRQMGYPTFYQRVHDWRYCWKSFDLYGVSAHYMIDRDGRILRLVDERNVAFDAGESRMPEPDGRTGINEFSVGIELIASTPEDNRAVSKANMFTDRQYTSLNWLLRDLCNRYQLDRSNLENRILGHDTIAPGRKHDPGPNFAWDRVRQRLLEDLSAIDSAMLAELWSIKGVGTSDGSATAR
jgi:hypothetical protein